MILSRRYRQRQHGMGVAAWELLLAACLVLLPGTKKAAGQTPRTDSPAMTMSAALPAFAMMLETGEAAGYWSRWRGPSGQGLTADRGYLDRWSETENVLWQTEVPGYGISSPIIWGGYVFITTAYDRKSAKRSNLDILLRKTAEPRPVWRSILAYRRSDGKLLWETFTPETDVPAEVTGRKAGWASPTPATDGERVYAYFGDHGLLAVDFASEVVWSRKLGQIDPKWPYGVASSPLLYRDRLIVVQDHRGSPGSFIAAFDKSTGRQLWSTPRVAEAGWSSPVAVRSGDQDQIIVSGQKSVRGYDPETGEELWSATRGSLQPVATPLVGHGLLYVAVTQGVRALRPNGKGAELLWEQPKGNSFVVSPVLYEDYLYTLKDHQGIVTCLDARSGDALWQGRLRPAAEGEEPPPRWKSVFSASPVAVDGKVFFFSDSGETFVLKAGAKFDLLHVNRLGEKVLASPALVDGRWYFRTVEHLLAIGPSS